MQKECRKKCNNRTHKDKYLNTVTITNSNSIALMKHNSIFSFRNYLIFLYIRLKIRYHMTLMGPKVEDKAFMIYGSIHKNV